MSLYYHIKNMETRLSKKKLRTFNKLGSRMVLNHIFILNFFIYIKKSYTNLYLVLYHI